MCRIGILVLSVLCFMAMLVLVIQAAGLFGKTNARHVNEKKGEKLWKP